MPDEGHQGTPQTLPWLHPKPQLPGNPPAQGEERALSSTAVSRAAWRTLTTTPLPQQHGCSHPEAPQVLRALPRGKTQTFVPDSSPVSLVEPSLQSSRCWENWKRRSRAFLAQETRRRCGQKRARCQEPAAGEKGLGRAKMPRGTSEERLRVPWDGNPEREPQRDQQGRLASSQPHRGSLRVPGLGRGPCRAPQSPPQDPAQHPLTWGKVNLRSTAS